MEPIRLIYASRARPGLQFDEVAAVRRGAKVFNRANDLTGLLLYGDDSFLQVLEGRSSTVNRCYHDRILKDDRHRQAHLLLVEPYQERLFPSWSAGLAQVNESVLQLLKLATGSAVFDPMRMRAETAQAFLQVMADLRQAKGLIN